MKYCPYCGVTLHDDMAFCPKCGKQFKEGTEEPVVATPAEPHVPEESKSEVTEENSASITIDSGKKGVTNPLPIILVVLLIVAAVVGGIIYFTQSGAAKPAVDNIRLPLVSSENAEPQKGPWSVEKAAESVLYLEVYDDSDTLIATASGFIFGNSNTVVTNYHVIEGAHHIVASPPNPLAQSSDGGVSIKGGYRLVTVLSYDKNVDLALLQPQNYIGIDPIPAGDSDKAKQGDHIFTVGYPLGIANTLSDGLVSSLYKDEYGVDLIQITAPISSGSSGGALFDESGNVIGVTCASYVAGQNLNLAVPISYVEKMLSKLEPDKYVSLADLYESCLPVYSVSYVLEHYDELVQDFDGMRTASFYLDCWVSMSERFDNGDRDVIAFCVDDETEIYWPQSTDSDEIYNYESVREMNGQAIRIQNYYWEQGEKLGYPGVVLPQRGDHILVTATAFTIEQ